MSSEEKNAHVKNWQTAPGGSKAELEVLAWVQSLGLEAYKYHLDGKELDVFIPSKNLAIEYNGLYSHSETIDVGCQVNGTDIRAKSIGRPKNYHKEKSDYFKSKGIRIIHLFEHIWRDRNEQVKSYIRSALGANENRIGARKCELKEVDSKEARAFLEKTHIQGAARHMTLALGLYYQDNLVALATFGVHHRDKTKMVLNRFAGATNWTVSGGLSRLTKEGAKRLGDIITWADLSLSDASGYINAGWIAEEELIPDYFYTNFVDVTSKQSRKKAAVNTPAGMTEHQHALLSGWFRIFDCGKLRLRFKNS
jgi:hypothetical protein